ncbi:MAG: BatA domain-containing protein, partial [Candidatus Brocadiaceae bacterium]
MIEFAAPGFLYALPAAFIPVLIHLLFRRRFRRVEWAAMEHLLRAERRARRSIRWRNLLLLALRVAAILLLVAVFSRPLIGGALAGLGAGRRGTEHVFVLLDDSPSMEHFGDAGSAFGRARGFAREVGRTLSGEGGRLTAFVAADGQPFFDASAGPVGSAALATALDGLSTSALPLRPEESFPALGAAATERGADEPRFYVVSDLRTVDWGRQRLASGAGAGLEALLDYGPVTLVDVGAPVAANAGLSDLTPPARFVYPGDRAVFRVVVDNDSGSALTAGRLEVSLDGSALAPVRHPQVPPGERREVPLPVRVREAGSHALAVRLRPGDEFPADDAHYLAFSAVRDVRVLVLEGRAGAAAYLRAALQPAEEGQGLR